MSDKLDETREAYDEFRGYMLDIVASARDEYVLRGKCAGVGGDGDGVPVGRRSNLKGGDAALLRNLVRANMEEGADGDVEGRRDKDGRDEGVKKGLTDDELLSNVFVSTRSSCS